MKLSILLRTTLVSVLLATQGQAFSQDAQAKQMAVMMAKIQDMQRHLVPAGTVVAFAGSKAPQGWLLCDGNKGKPLARAEYPELFQAIGYAHGGSGDFFMIPDYRGVFLRGVDAGRGKDPEAGQRAAMASGGNAGNQVGSVQDSAFQSHAHSGTTGAMNSNQTHRHGANGITWTSKQNFLANGVWPSPVYPEPVNETGAANIDHTHSFTTQTSGTSQETRPSNAYVNYIIKY